MTAESPDLSATARRSFIYRVLAGEGARFEDVGKGAVATRFGDDLEAEVAAARSMGLADLSPLPRSGFKGRGALAWLAAEGVSGIDADNWASVQADGSVAARLAPTEAVLLSGPAGGADLIDRLAEAWSAETAPGCYPVMRRDGAYWFRITGENAPKMFAKICGIDLRLDRFAQLAIAQTSAMRSNVIIIRQDLGATPGFHLLGDSASADYIWRCLRDAMEEFAGRPVGLDALQSLVEG